MSIVAPRVEALMISRSLNLANCCGVPVTTAPNTCISDVLGWEFSFRLSNIFFVAFL